MGDHQEQAEYYIGYDDNYFYAAARMHFLKDSPVRAISRKRDSFDPGQDYFGVILDTFNDNENALGFWTTPSGIRLDIAVFNDAQGDFPLNDSWNTFWDVKCQVVDTTWNVEMRIPFTSLRFQDQDGRVTMGTTCWWWHPSHAETLIYPATPREWGPWSTFKASKFHKITLDGVFSKNPVYIAPYVLTGASTESELNEAGTAYGQKTDGKIEAGVDAKISLSNAWTLDLTANTDFAQVEADNQQVNLTRFSLFFPEKRIFFQERSSLFAFTSGPIAAGLGPSLGYNQLFYSRRIGLDSANNVVRILGGTRLSGRMGRTDIGFLDMQTANTQNQASTNYGVARIRRTVGKTNSYIGTMVTNEIDTEGNYSTSAGIDGVFNLGHDNFLSVNAAGVADTSAEARMFDLLSSKLYANLTRRSLGGLGYDLTYAYIGKNYNPAMGFELRNENIQLGNKVWYGWFPGSEAWLLNHRVSIEGYLYKNTTDHRNDSGKLGIGWTFESKTGAEGKVLASYNNEFIREDFELYDSYVNTGEYDFPSLEGYVNTGSQSSFALLAGWYLGKFYDGSNFTLNLMPSWKVSPAFNLITNYQYVGLRFSDRLRDADIHFAGINAEISFSSKLTANLFWQYNSYDDQLFGNLRFRYNPREGNDLYIVFNDVLNTTTVDEIPRNPTNDSSVILIKYTYTFVFSR